MRPAGPVSHDGVATPCWLLARVWMERTAAFVTAFRPAPQRATLS
jgi:hypothetical protein